SRDAAPPQTPAAKLQAPQRPIQSRPPYPIQQAQYVPVPAPAAPGGVVRAGHHCSPHGGCPCCGPGTLPAFAFTGFSPEETGMPWKPDGIKGPWPRDEYLCDGGDLNHDVYVKKDWTVVGLDQQDTIAHYDTLDGQVQVAASNCVCVYAPRF